MQHLIKFRIPALFCALSVLICELISRPYVNMGVCDDWPYILMAQHLATTGHILYNGWEAAMVGWQLYLAAAFIQLFGYSLTTARMSTLFVSMALAFVLQRCMVRAGISERNATLGTLAFALSPLYLMLSVTFMSDIQGLFAIVICLYGCLRALQASTSRATVAWLCFAVVTNAICGTSRQIVWLGILVMVPSTLWLLRAQRRVLLAGVAVTLAGALFILGCMHWFALQPFILPEHLSVDTFPVALVLWQFVFFFLEFPLLLLPVAALFLPELRKSSPRVLVVLLIGYVLVAVHPHHIQHVFLLEPTLGNWVNIYGTYNTVPLGLPPLFLGMAAQVLLTIASFGGLLGLIAVVIRSRSTPSVAVTASPISWHQLGFLIAPLVIVYTLILIPRAATTGIYDRYMLGLLVVVLLCLVRFYQERVQARFPMASLLLVAIMAVYGVAATHNMFALDRARVELATKLRSVGVPETSVDNGWEYNMGIELQHAGYINDFRIVIPEHAYVPTPPPPADHCPMYWYDRTPHVHPLYGVSFDPNKCYGPAPFAPVHYSRWLASGPGTLYVVRYTPPTKP